MVWLVLPDIADRGPIVPGLGWCQRYAIQWSDRYWRDEGLITAGLARGDAYVQFGFCILKVVARDSVPRASATSIMFATHGRCKILCRGRFQLTK